MARKFSHKRGSATKERVAHRGKVASLGLTDLYKEDMTKSVSAKGQNIV